MNIIKLNTEEVNIFFTSDTHFGHANIIKFCNRPFSSVEEMNAKLIEAWNSVVGPNDVVFHLGDFAFGGAAVWNSCIDQLNGKIHLVLGNHDIKNIRQGFMNKFASVQEQLLLNIDGRLVYLNHYPFLCYGGSYRNDKTAVYQLYGHVHSGPTSSGLDSDRLYHTFPWQYDVGVDNNNYKPVSWSEVDSLIKAHAIDYPKESGLLNTLLKHMEYSLKDINSYEELTDKEKEIISPSDFEKLMIYLERK